MKFNFIKNKSTLFKVTKNQIKDVEKDLGLKFPIELSELLIQEGYGFLNLSTENINRIMDPYSIKDIRLRLDEYESDPDLEIYEDFEDNKLIFFEANEGTYLSIELTKEYPNAIFFFDNKVANSLEEFLMKMLKDDKYYLNLSL